MFRKPRFKARAIIQPSFLQPQDSRKTKLNLVRLISLIAIVASVATVPWATSMKTETMNTLHPPTSTDLGESIMVRAGHGNPWISAAATLTVTNTNDSGPGSLRQAIIDAASGDIINFNIPANDPSCTGGVCTIALAGELGIDKDLTIQGPGANQLTVSGNNAVRVFNITAGNFTVTFSNLTIANGAANGGGGISNHSTGTLNVVDTTISGSAALACGGPIFDNKGGGAISNVSTGTLNVLNSTLSGNTACVLGGGIYNANTGAVNITSSTFSGNSAPGSCGGGIYNGFGVVTIINSTFSGNSNSNGPGGGAICNDTFGGTVLVTNSTISGNSGFSGGGIINISGGTAVVKNTIIALNTASSSGPDVQGSFTSQGYNLIGANDGSTGFVNGVNGDQVGTGVSPIDPLLASLANNGGPTQTRALLAGSPAIDKGSAANNPGTGTPITTDQRGLTRPVDDPVTPNAAGGDGSDIGAFEAQSPPITTPTPTPTSTPTPTPMPTTCVQPPAGVISWWPMDETNGTIAMDVVGNKPGAHFAGPTPVLGKVRGALQFDGVDDFVGAGDSDLWAFGNRDFTLELWANFDTTGSGSISEPGDILIGNDEGPGPRNKWFFALGGGVLNFTVYNVNSPPSNFFLVRAPFSPIVGQWYHLAVTKTGTLFTIFVNGIPVGSEVSTSPIANANAPLTIGQAESIGFMNGRLDEVTIYDRALPHAELQIIAGAGTLGKCKPLPSVGEFVSPSRGGDTGSVTVRITGNGFMEGASAKLSRTGNPNIVGSAARLSEDSTTLTATFDLTGKARGLWDVVVINPDGTTTNLPNAFAIEEGRPAHVWEDIVGSGAIRAGRNQQFNIFYGNRGNVDATDVILWLALPSAVTFLVDVPYLEDIGSPPRDILTELDGNHYLWFYVDTLGASETRSIPLRLNINAAGQIGIRSGILEGAEILQSLSLQQSSITRSCPSFNSHNLSDKGDQNESSSVFQVSNIPKPGEIVFKLSDPMDPAPTGHTGIYIGEADAFSPEGYVIDFVLSGTSGHPLVVADGHLRRVPLRFWALDTYQGSGRPSGLSDDELARIADQAISYYNDWIILGSPFLPYSIPPRGRPIGDLPAADDCVSFVNDRYRDAGFNPPWSDWSSPGAIYEVTTSRVWPEKIYRFMDNFKDAIIQNGLFFLILFSENPPTILTVVNSLDPNDKVGSRGAEAGQYLSAEEPLRYSIVFENIETASAPAQEVVITDQLDTSKIDLESFSLGPITFGNKQLVPPQNLTEYTTTVDLRPALQLLVKVEGHLNKTTGLLTWRFTSIDPITGELPDDPLAGFLPQNRVPPEGDGSVLFTVMPKKGLATGTEIRNKARIIFDVNEPIDTPEWFNTIDNSKPASNVLPLTASQCASDLQVQWAGTDEGSGIANYTIYVSDNGAPFTVWQQNTTATSGIYTGQFGHTYAFYSVAQDKTGNIEDAPANPDATVTLSAPAPPIFTSVPPAVTAYTGQGATACGTFVSDTILGTASAQSACSAVNVTRSGVPSGNIFPIGQTTITYTATDATGNSVRATQTVTVIDNTPPTITTASASPASLWPPNHTMRDVQVNYAAMDNCSSTCTLSVTSNEPVNGTGDGDTAPDWEIVDAHHVQLRAERAAIGNGRMYTITVTCTDGAGNSTSKDVAVFVTHNIAGPASGAAFKIGTTVNFSGTFWDLPGRKHTAQWVFDDVLLTTGKVVEPSGSKSGTVTGTYTFTTPGVYKIKLKVTDNTGQTSWVDTAGDVEAIVVIYDPNAGYTIGGGYISTYAGSYPADLSKAGKLSFGFNSKYTNATNPKGETQIQFAIGGFEFNALNYDYLAMSGARAQFRGFGKVNGESGYNFILTVIDGQLKGGGGVDKFRIKIWNKTTGAIIFDSQMGASDAADPSTPVGTGSSIVIQK